jgi:hypothetical protein
MIDLFCRMSGHLSEKQNAICLGRGSGAEGYTI